MTQKASSLSRRRAAAKLQEAALRSGEVDVLMSPSIDEDQRHALHQQASAGQILEAIGPATEIGYITDQTWPSQYQPMLLTSAPSAPVGSTIDDVSIDITPRFFVPSDVTYSIEMFDSGANGWNGNGISLFANGSQVLSTTFFIYMNVDILCHFVTIFIFQ